MELLVVLTTCPSPESAQKIAEQLVSEGLAACVNILPAINSVFVWQGKLEHAQESMLIIKALKSNLQKLERRVSEIHPYDVPEFVVLEPSMVAAKYLDWASTGKALGQKL